MPEINWKNDLIDQLTFDWDYLFMERMNGLTDEEYLWAPVADVWTVHAGPPAFVDGGEDRDPAPFTTIAWRMNHMARFFTIRWADHFNGGWDETPIEVGLTAADGMRILTQAYERWRDTLMAMPEERLAQPCGTAENPYFAEFPFSTLMLHITRECIHHAAECCLIRDLYRQRDTWSG